MPGQDGSERDIPTAATSDRKGEKRRHDLEDVDSKRKRECPGPNNDSTNGSKSSFLLDRFQKTQGPKKPHIQINSRPFFSQKLNVSEVLEAPAKKLERKNCIKEYIYLC